MINTFPSKKLRNLLKITAAKGSADMNAAMGIGSEGEEFENANNEEVFTLDTDSSHVDGGGGEGGAAETGFGSSTSSTCVFRAIPPFLQKLFEMLENNEFSNLVSWSSAGTSFVIKNPHSFAANVLPLYYKHNNFHSFTTQLHSYGFKKFSWERCEYQNEYFRRGQRDLLKSIKRRDHYSKMISQASSSARRSRIFQAEEELAVLTKKHDQTKVQLLKLKENQRALDDRRASLRSKITSNEKEQKRLMMVAQKVLEKWKDGRECRVPMLVESSDQRKGKRKLDDVVSSDASRDNIEEKIVLFDEEEFPTNLQDAEFPQEELYRGPMDWVEYIKELQNGFNGSP